MTPGNFEKFLPRLSSYGVRYILIGGGAGIAQGLARATYDVDIVYDRSPDNMAKLIEALADLHLYFRGAPPGLPFLWDVAFLQSGLNFTLTSDWGDIDLLGEVAGEGTYAKLISHCDQFELYGHDIDVVSLKKLIELKRAAGRPKDFEVIAELEALQQERHDNPAS